MSEELSQLTEVLSAPIGDLISQVGRGVAEAQEALDQQALESLRRIYNGDVSLAALRDIGYKPTWYQIPEASAELTVALSIRGGGQTGQGKRASTLFAAPVDATYANRFSYNLKAASKITFRIVPVPPSTGAEAMRVVPALIGLTVGEAKVRLAERGLVPSLAAGLADGSRIASQSPAADSLVQAQAVVVLS